MTREEAHHRLEQAICQADLDDEERDGLLRALNDIADMEFE